MHDGDGRSQRFSALAWFCAAAVIAYVQRTAISIVAPQLEVSLNASASAMGVIMSSYYWAYAFSQIPSGLCVQRFGARNMLMFAVGVSSLMAMLVAGTWSESSFGVVWLLAGIAVSGIFPACVRGIMQCFPSNARAFPSGALSSFMSVGSVIALNLTPRMLAIPPIDPENRWRWVYLAYGLPGVLWAIAFGLWSKKTVLAHSEHSSLKYESGHSSLKEDRDHSSPMENCKNGVNPFQSLPDADVPGPELNNEQPVAVLDHDRWLCDYRTWLICGQQFFRAGGYVFYATWFPTYLMKVHNVSLEAAGLLTSLPVAGVVVGGTVGGVIGDVVERLSGSKRLSRQGMGFVSHALCGLLILAAQPIQDPNAAVALITLGSFVFALGSSASYAMPMDMGGRRSATLFATMNMCGNIGAAISPIVVGILADKVGWSPVLPVFAGIYIAASICWAFLNPEPVLPRVKV
ncbi:MAG: MFS transporter [Planctomyces sp.]|nr:MFS transporter [Planctomyces sp.]